MPMIRPIAGEWAAGDEGHRGQWVAAAQVQQGIEAAVMSAGVIISFLLARGICYAATGMKKSEDAFCREMLSLLTERVGRIALRLGQVEAHMHWQGDEILKLERQIKHLLQPKAGRGGKRSHPGKRSTGKRREHPPKLKPQA